jgi:Ni/Fe-hydrogenase 1 B-type cytochrome subunit
MILTGLAMHGAHQPVGTLMHGFVAWMEPFGGLPGARWIHHVAMWLLLGFAVHHVYSATLVSNVERTGTVDSIFSGYKWMKRKDADR